MGEYTYQGNLGALLKTKYVDKISDAYFDENTLQKKFPIKKKWSPGAELKIPVVVSKPQGLTFGGSNTTAFTLNTSVAIETVQASLYTSNFSMEVRVAKDLIDRMTADKTAAFDKELKVNIAEASKQARFAQELSLMHGRAGIGTILAQTDDSDMTQTFSLTARTFVPLIWACLENGYIDVYNGASKINAAGTIHVDSYSIEDHTITVTGTEAELDNIAAGHTIYPQGGYDTAMMQGLSLFCGSTAATIHSLAQGTYPIWKSNVLPIGGSKLTYAKVVQAVSMLRKRGCFSNLTLLVDADSAADLRTELVKLTSNKKSGVRYDSETRTLGINGQDISIEEHALAKPGEALLFSEDVLSRVGRDLNFEQLGDGENSYYQALPGVHGGFYRVGWNIALVCEKLAHTLKISEVKYGASE